MITYTINEWIDEGKKRFGENVKQWKFVCPQCKTVQTIQELLDAGVAKDNVDGFIGFSCIGRFTRNEKGCDWTLGGLFHMHEAMITYPGTEHKSRPVFQFAEGDGNETTDKDN